VEEEFPVAIEVNGSLSGQNTIRNLSLIKRTISKTSLRPAQPEEESGSVNRTSDSVSSENMRAHISSLTQTIKNLERNSRRNDVTRASLNDLQEKLVELREVAKEACKNRDTDEVFGKECQRRIDTLAAEYNQKKNAAGFEGRPLFDGSKESVAKLRDFENLRAFDPDDAKESLAKIQSAARQIDKLKSELEIAAEREYEDVVSSLEASARAADEAEATARDKDWATAQAARINNLVRTRATQAAAAQGNMAGEAVFRLMQA
jgi:flagellin-like hook-associated protein FlgL